MSRTSKRRQRRTLSTAPPGGHPNQHDLIAIAQWLPGKRPTNAEIDLNGGAGYETQYWRCRKCGQERGRPDEFEAVCPVDRLPSPIETGGYSIEDPRTRRALTEDMTVHFGEPGPDYQVDSESGATYRVDVEAEMCTCPDHRDRGTFCKHLRRVDLEIRTGVTPGPDGTFVG